MPDHERHDVDRDTLLRLADEANEIKVGHGPDLREVRDADEALAPQRALAR